MTTVLSICVPTYTTKNREGRIGKLIDEFKIIKRKYKELIEIIVIDDSEFDKTIKFKEDLKKSDIVYLKNSNRRGLINNFAFSLEKCNGTYIMPISDEDKINMFFIDMILNTLKKGECNAVFGTVKALESNSIWYNWGNKEFKSSKDVLNNRIAFYGHFSGYILKKDSINVDAIVNIYNNRREKHYFPVTAAILMCAKNGKFLTFSETICYCGVFAGKEYDINSLEGVPYNHPKARVATIDFIKTYFIDKILNDKEKEYAQYGLFKQFIFLFKNDAKFYDFSMKSSIEFIAGVKKNEEMKRIVNNRVTLYLIVYKVIHYIKNVLKKKLKKIIGRV